MILFDLAARFPILGTKLRILMRDESSAIEVIGWIDEYLADLFDAGAITYRERLDCQAAIAMSIGVGEELMFGFANDESAQEEGDVMYDNEGSALDRLVAQFPSYQWRIWTRRHCDETGGHVLSASPFFLDMPNEVLFLLPCTDDAAIEALVRELNARAGWDDDIQRWQASRLLHLTNSLPAPTLGTVGHG